MPEAHSRSEIEASGYALAFPEEKRVARDLNPRRNSDGDLPDSLTRAYADPGWTLEKTTSAK
ncbi:hypothetical protein N7535_005729 [Penicillium sp. DV-2018c]|nr:hypothetical protein N7461_009304 [Penicillium sp. DV-2018c]KAJ5572069.1 hypothetical protein N7535_005729 [Penicillium sp. DV-2018c]